MNASFFIRSSVVALTLMAVGVSESNAQSYVSSYSPVVSYYPTVTTPTTYVGTNYGYTTPTYYNGSTVYGSTTVLPTYNYGTVPSSTYWNTGVVTQPNLLINPLLPSYQGSWSQYNNYSNNNDWWRWEQLRREREHDHHFNQFGHNGSFYFR